MLSNNIIQYLLEGFINNDVKDEEIVTAEVINKESEYKCYNCEQGPKRHKPWPFQTIICLSRKLQTVKTVE